MNIFVLSADPIEAAQMMCDKHVPKMIVESAQMLSTAHRMLDGTPDRRPSKSGKTMQAYYAFDDSAKDDLLYKAVHKYHPCTVWTMESKDNYIWHYKHMIALGNEFEYRFNKPHATITKLGAALAKIPNNIPDKGLTPFALAMKAYPECVVEGDAVQSYRNFYHADKLRFAKWDRGRDAPKWWSVSVSSNRTTGMGSQVVL